MPSSRGCRSSYDCIVKIKGVTARPILFSQLMRSDGEGVTIAALLLHRSTLHCYSAPWQTATP